MSEVLDRLRTGRGSGFLAHVLAAKNEYRRDGDSVIATDKVFSLLFLAFVEQSKKKIAHLLSKRYPGVAIDVEFDETIWMPPLVCRWSCSPSGRTTCTFGRFVFEKSAGDSIHRWTAMFPFFMAVAADGGFPGHVALNLGDLGSHPGLAFCDFRDVFTLIPDFAFIEADGYSNYRRHFEDVRPWAARSDTVFWRGSSTGHETHDAAKLPRVQLCLLARDHADLQLDFGISQVVQLDADQSKFLLESGLCREFVPWQNLDHYKYHIDIDGNTNSWPGLIAKLHSGALIFKVTSPHGYRQWYYHRLLPWVHYIPVRSDLGDLLERIAFMREHQDLAATIARQGRDFARTMTLESEMRHGSRAVRAEALRSMASRSIA